MSVKLTMLIGRLARRIELDEWDSPERKTRLVYALINMASSGEISAADQAILDEVQANLIDSANAWNDEENHSNALHNLSDYCLLDAIEKECKKNETTR